MDPIGESPQLSRRDFLRFPFVAGGNAASELKDQSTVRPDTERQNYVNQQLEHMGFPHTRAEVNFYPGDHMLNKTHLALFQNDDAVTGEIDRNTMCVIWNIEENAGQFALTFPQQHNENKGVLWSLMHPGIEVPTKERIMQSIEIYRELKAKGVNMYSGDVSSSAISQLQSIDALESANTLNVGIAGLSAMLQVGLIANSVAELRNNEPMTRRKFLKLGGKLGLAAGLNKILRLQMNFDFSGGIPLGRQPALEHAIDAEASIEEAIRDLGLTDSQYETYTKMLVEHRNNIMALHAWRTLGEEAQTKEDPKVSIFYGTGHGRTEDIFDKGPEYCEDQIHAHATTYLTDGLDYLIEGELSDEEIILALENGMTLYPPCLRHGDAVLRDALVGQVLPRTAQMIFGDSLVEQLESASQNGDHRRVHILTEAMKKFIELVNERVYDEGRLTQYFDAPVGHIEEDRVAHRRDVRTSNETDEVASASGITGDPSYTALGRYLQIGLYRDTNDTYPLVLSSLEGGDEDKEMMLQEVVLTTRGHLEGVKYTCEPLGPDDIPDGVSHVIFVQSSMAYERVARDILNIVPGDREMLTHYDVYRANGVIAGIENPFVLRFKNNSSDS
jgi:hypothetical protein